VRARGSRAGTPRPRYRERDRAERHREHGEPVDHALEHDRREHGRGRRLRLAREVAHAHDLADPQREELLAMKPTATGAEQRARAASAGSHRSECASAARAASTPRGRRHRDAEQHAPVRARGTRAERAQVHSAQREPDGGERDREADPHARVARTRGRSPPTRTVRSRLRQPPPRLVGIGGDLRPQRIDAREFALRAQPDRERELDAPPVEIAAPVERVRLGESTFSPRSNVGRRPTFVTTRSRVSAGGSPASSRRSVPA
jgi:hypothetical protein